MDNLERHSKVCNMLHELYKVKNEAYGNSFGEAYEEWGPITAITRITDKWNRIKALMKGAKNGVKDESLKDTVRDIANYFIMWYMELDAREPKNTTQYIDLQK